MSNFANYSGLGTPPGTRKVNRWEPQAPAWAYNTYQIVSPLSTNFRKATCEEVQCVRYLEGWRIPVAKLTQQLYKDATTLGPKYSRETVDGEDWLVYPAGQTCFDGLLGKHRVRIDSRPQFYRKGGDYRGNPRNVKPVRFGDLQSWVDSMGEQLDKIHERIERG